VRLDDLGSALLRLHAFDATAAAVQVAGLSGDNGRQVWLVRHGVEASSVGA
jgi:hypothetical protein